MQRLYSIFKYFLLTAIILCLAFSKTIAGTLEITFVSDSVQKGNFTEATEKYLASDLFFYESSDREFDTAPSLTFSVFNPDLFSNSTDSTYKLKGPKRAIASNVQITTDSLFIKTVTDTVIELDDSTKIGLFGIVTPDFPALYPQISTNFAFRFDIFTNTNMILKKFKENETDLVFAFNYLDEYLNYELLQRFPEIDYIFDFFKKGTNDYSEKRYLKDKLKNIDFTELIFKKFIFYYTPYPNCNIDSLYIHNKN